MSWNEASARDAGRERLIPSGGLPSKGEAAGCRAQSVSPEEGSGVSLRGDFEAVLAAARAGAEWAWTAIYEDLAPAILGYLRARGAPDAEDVVGEVFLEVVRDLSRFSGDEGGFRAWVFTVARHNLLDARKRRGRRPVDPVPDEILERAGPRGDAEEEAMRSVEVGWVRAILERLSPDQGEVLALRIFGQLTVDEVARVLGKSPGAVKALQRRGLAGVLREISERPVTL